jgi:2-polyprenyl-6-methoxyphenol hydroxylase-like FAD-dependent oxidoreductase
MWGVLAAPVAITTARARHGPSESDRCRPNGRSLGDRCRRCTARREARGDLRGAYHRIVGESAPLATTLRTATCSGGYRAFAGVPGFVRQAFGPGWALVEDASHFKDPVSAHGITDAFIGAELLSDALVAILAEGAEPDEMLGAYGRQRDELTAMLMPPVADLARLDLSPADAERAFRRLNPALRAEFELMSGRPAPTSASPVVGAAR